MTLGKRRLKLSGAEQDTFTRWRRLYCYLARPGVTAGAGSGTPARRTSGKAGTMPRGWSEVDPEKGVPHRHTRAKIRLLLAGGKREWLEEALLRVSEKHPDAVLDAIAGILAEHEDDRQPDVEFRLNAARFIAGNDQLLQALEDDGITVTG